MNERNGRTGPPPPPQRPGEMVGDDRLDEPVWTVGRIAALVAFVFIAGLWAYGFSPWAPRTPPDRLDDQTFPRAAEPICAATMEIIDDLPRATAADGPLERADQIEASTAVLEDMVGELRSIAPRPDAGDEPAIIDRWLDDWEIYLDDRLAYAADFRNGIDRQFAVTEKDGDQITDPIDGFANANTMPSCGVPIDV